jgi:hypothetical protein
MDTGVEKANAPLIFRVTVPEGGTLPAGGTLEETPKVTVTVMVEPTVGVRLEGVTVRTVELGAVTTVIGAEFVDA